MLHITEMLDKCKAEGVSVSRIYLYVAGQKHGFIKRNKDGSLELLRAEFLKWIEKEKEVAPDGFVTIADCAKNLGISAGTVYAIAKANPSIIKKVGTRSLMYVQSERVADIIAKNKNVYGFKEN